VQPPPHTALAAHWNWSKQPGSGAVRVCCIALTPEQPPRSQPTSDQTLQVQPPQLSIVGIWVIGSGL